MPSSVNSRELAQLNIPVIITSHDVWNLTGGCHCNLGCEEWRVGCIECPQIEARIPSLASPAKTFQKKLKIFRSIQNLGIVAPSNWIGDMHKESPMFIGRRIEVIPNPGNTSIFRLTSDYSARVRKVGRENDFRLMYVVSGEFDAYHKGFDLFKEIIKILDYQIKRNVQIILVGDCPEVEISLNEINLCRYGQVESEEEMSGLLNLADVVVSTTRQDNLPNSIIESILCGTPVISFDIGGISEIIDNQKNGVLINPFDLIEFSEYLNRFINEESGLKLSRTEIAHDAFNRFSEKSIATRYANFYKEMGVEI
jgi:glycosyltransferase involved in cell wall biosynthesis